MPLSLKQILLLIFSLCVVALGQPLWSKWLGLLAAIVGYALFWTIIVDYPSWKKRFWLSFGWFFGVQLLQLSWFISHPYHYIYAVYLFASALMSLQFAILAIFIQPIRLKSFLGMASVAAIWTLLEWSRTYMLSGFVWNPLGLALTGHLYSLQMASLAGMLGLSFWVIFVNMLALDMFRNPNIKKSVIWASAALLPFVFGWTHLAFHEHQIAQKKTTLPVLNAVLVQTAFPIEEIMDSPTQQDMVGYVMQEWRQILTLSKKHQGKPIDLLVLPEFVVPYGTYSFVYPFELVKQTFVDVFGPESLDHLPLFELPLGTLIHAKPMVNNAYWVQGLANYHRAHVLTGMEDAEDVAIGKREYYSAAMFFSPHEPDQTRVLDKECSSFERDFLSELKIFPKPIAHALQARKNFSILEEKVLEGTHSLSKTRVQVERYEKRILVPMGEYIPFEFCRELAASYGVAGSFTCGTAAKSFICKESRISPSICYEEIFGDLMREGRHQEANVYVNLTSDVWYPNSTLPCQHFDHARPRTVENGVPLLRACNTGITAAVDSLGRDIAVLGGARAEEVEWVPDALYAQIPLYHYGTLYTLLGDRFMIALCMIILVLNLAKFYSWK